MDVGVFIPIANNGWLISKASPQYPPSFALNRDVPCWPRNTGSNLLCR